MTIPSQSYCFSGIVTLYVSFFVSLLLHTLASPIPHYCRHDQRDALLEFKHEFPVNESISNPHFISWNKSSDCCSWNGVTCNAKSGEVISLDFTAFALNNSLKPNSGLFKLQHLRNLTLTLCHLYGEIPSSLGNLSHLTHLDLSYNNLVGEIPVSIGNLSHLTHLNLWENSLVGEVPVSIGNLAQLRYLCLSENKLSGYIPLSFANFTKLSYLDISDNQFTGQFPLVNLTTSLSSLSISNNLFKSTLPSDMSPFHNLEYFDVSRNSFFGPFPLSLFTIHSLIDVCLSENQFKGPIEFRNTSSSSKLLFLDLDYNKFHGPIPIDIIKLVNLDRLHLNNNNFSGPIPRSNLVNLSLDLDLSNNKLKGEIPSWLGSLSELKLAHNSFSSFEESFGVLNLSNIYTLDLSSNSFRGPLPHWICKLRLFFLDLSNNNFSGPISQCLRNTMAHLETLNLQNNNFSGILLPDLFVNATKLSYVDIRCNQLEGKLPESLINCTSLELLNVGSNRIKDKFPSWMGSLVSLNILILRSNEFYGPLYHPHVSIGFQSLQIIDISHNNFNGTLPTFYFNSWREMTIPTEEFFYLTNYMGYSGVGQFFNSSMEMVNKGVDTRFEIIQKDFRAIDFSGNNLFGKIPKSIGLLNGLHLLNLSGNGFTSNIPQSLSNLTNLEGLDLSRNQLSGQIPPNLGNLSFLSIMNFSHNNLQGPIPRGTQFLSQTCSAFTDNPKLYGLEDVCGETHFSNLTPQESEDFSEPEEEMISWIAAAIAYGPGVFCGLVIGHIFSSHKHKWSW